MVTLVDEEVDEDAAVVAVEVFSQLRCCRDQLTELPLVRAVSPSMSCFNELLRIRTAPPSPPPPPLLEGPRDLDESDDDDDDEDAAELKSLLVRLRPLSMLSYMRSC